MFMRKLWQRWRPQRGAAGVEGAITLPVFFMLFFAVAGISIGCYTRLLSAAGVPAGVRWAGITESAGAGRGVTSQMLSATNLGSQAAGSFSVAMPMPGCQRMVQGQLHGAGTLKVPFLDAAPVPIHAGSVQRVWKFWAGPPEDICQ